MEWKTNKKTHWNISLSTYILFVKNVMGNFANKNLKWVSDIMTSKNQAIFNNAATRWR